VVTQRPAKPFTPVRFRSSPYWRRQFAQIEPRVEPRWFTDGGDGPIAVAVHQVVRDRGGNVVADREVTPVYAFRDRLIGRMDVSEPPA